MEDINEFSSCHEDFKSGSESLLKISTDGEGEGDIKNSKFEEKSIKIQKNDQNFEEGEKFEPIKIESSKVVKNLIAYFNYAADTISKNEKISKKYCSNSTYSDLFQVVLENCESENYANKNVENSNLQMKNEAQELIENNQAVENFENLNENEDEKEVEKIDYWNLIEDEMSKNDNFKIDASDLANFEILIENKDEEKQKIITQNAYAYYYKIGLSGEKVPIFH